MQSNNKSYSPFVRSKDSISSVMFDVVLALLPCMAISYLAFGFTSIVVILVAIGSALLAEFLFSFIFLNKKEIPNDGSAIVTAILLAFTIAPFTPLYVVAFGGAMAVIFGKLLWGGIGRNTFNPALVGREFMTIFFPLVMTSRTIWYNKEAVVMTGTDVFSDSFLNNLLFKPSGAIGEYSVFLLILGGVYLLLRRRISWHIPLGVFLSFFILLMIFLDKGIQFSLGGIVLGTIFMATDMPSSASARWGKLYYGIMIGVVAMLCILNDVRFEYMSYSILLLNAFVKPIDQAFVPKVWGKELDIKNRVVKVLIISVSIIAATFGVIYLHSAEMIKYLVFIYIAFCIMRFILVEMRGQKINKAKQC